MEKDIAEEGLERLKNIEEELEEIKDRAPGPKRAFLNGIFQWAGAIFGSLIALAFLGWALAVFGVIPGVGDMIEYVRGLIAQVRR